MKVSVTAEVRSFTVKLSNGMFVTIFDVGHGPLGPDGQYDGQPVISVRQKSRDLLNGAPSAPDVPRYDPGGEYEFALPDAVTIADLCSARDHDPDDLGYPRDGVAAISVWHIHS